MYSNLIKLLCRPLMIWISNKKETIHFHYSSELELQYDVLKSWNVY